MEVWTGALQIASNLHVEFRRSGDETAIEGIKIVSRIDVDPSHLSRTYTGPDFSVEEQIWVPIEQPAALFRYEIRSRRPVQVILKFTPSLNLMWPAAIGGQEMRWDPAQSGYLLSEPSHSVAAAVLVPGSPGHDEPLNSARPLPSGDELSVALDPKSPQVLIARLQPSQQKSEAGLDMDAAQKLLQSTDWQKASVQHTAEVFSSGIRIETPDADVNRALDWAAIALDEAWFCNEQLGCAYVGGYGPSRRGRRPQYAWYFAGDGMISMHAALARGDLDRARDELRFIAKYQDAQTGMIWHELSQSAPYLDWRGKYPYMFVHADVTYPYISSVADYVRRSDDRHTLHELWPSVQKAFGYGRSLIAEDGLPRIPTGKLGGNEQESHSDEIDLSASWVKACADYAHLAELMDDSQAAQSAHEQAEKARSSFTGRYWDAQQNLPIQAYSRSGKPEPERGIGAIGALNEQLFSPAQGDRVLDTIASWRFQSDWGTRNFAIGDPAYDPTAYAHGSVWALASSEVAEGYWSEHRPDIAWGIWRKLVPWSTLDSPGHMHEVLEGDLYQPQEESVPEQTWSSASFLSSVLQGLFGLDINAENKTVTLAPHLPPEWDHATLTGLKIGNNLLSFSLRQTLGQFSLHIETPDGPLHLRLNPEIPLGAQLESASACGRHASVRIEPNSEDEHALLDLAVSQGSCDVSITYQGGVVISMPPPHPSLGNSSTSAELTSVRRAKDTLRLDLDLIPDIENKIFIHTQERVVSATPAKLNKSGENLYELTMPA
ncbi:MAG TPA: hypothetical protein VJQ54_20445, partial [Candidatus Sulfotelmatobacter sp.]|nr:hypothetical protein [Candidatus Sulfotelmatobacter sp.]